jgi:site-specific recombinase XerD
MRAVGTAAERQTGEFPLRDLVDEYCVALEVGGRSRRTIDWYRGYLDEFVAFVARDGRSSTLDNLTAATSRRWLLALQATRSKPLAPNSMAGRVRTLRAFGGWVQRELALGANPLAGLPLPKLPDVLVESLREHEMRALVAAASAQSHDPVRDRAIVLLLLDSGLRLGELVRLRVGDLDLVEGRCRVVGKGAKERIVPMGGRSRRALRSWLLTRGSLTADAAVFVSRQGGALSPRGVELLIGRLARAAAISTRCSPHILRHSFARAFLANGGDVFTLQRILGHSPTSLQITRRYVHLLDDDVRAVHRRASPIDRL